MIVVSDTSPLHYLVLIEAVEVLPKLYREVMIPLAVQHELQHAKTPRAVRDWLDARPPWLNVQEVRKVDPGLDKLDPGEAEAITLARALKAEHLLIDERQGTKLAKKLGLRPLSLLTVLDQAGEAGFIDVPDKIRRLRSETTYRMTQRLVDQLLENEARRRPQR